MFESFYVCYVMTCYVILWHLMASYSMFYYGLLCRLFIFMLWSCLCMEVTILFVCYVGFVMARADLVT